MSDEKQVEPATEAKPDAKPAKRSAAAERIDELEAALRKQAGRIEALESKAESLLEQIKRLDQQIDELRERPRKPLTAAEVTSALSKNPAARFVALAGYPPIGLRQGEVFEARVRVRDAQTLGSYVNGGLKIAIAA